MVDVLLESWFKRGFNRNFRSPAVDAGGLSSHQRNRSRHARATFLVYKVLPRCVGQLDEAQAIALMGEVAVIQNGRLAGNDDRPFWFYFP
jgi:hypothetical protein